MMRRRSIVEFEKWIDAEITAVEVELLEAGQRRAAQEVRLETLKVVKAKLELPDLPLPLEEAARE